MTAEYPDVGGLTNLYAIGEFSGDNNPHFKPMVLVTDLDLAKRYVDLYNSQVDTLMSDYYTVKALIAESDELQEVIAKYNDDLMALPTKPRDLPNVREDVFKERWQQYEENLAYVIERNKSTDNYRLRAMSRILAKLGLESSESQLLNYNCYVSEARQKGLMLKSTTVVVKKLVIRVFFAVGIEETTNDPFVLVDKCVKGKYEAPEVKGYDKASYTFSSKLTDIETEVETDESDDIEDGDEADHDQDEM